MMKRVVVLAMAGLLGSIGFSACGKKHETTLNLVGHPNGSSSLAGLTSVGDEMSIHEQLTRAGQPYGNGDGGCIADTSTTANCALTLKLPGGTAVFQGRVNVRSQTLTLPIGQGTGKYLDNSGFMELDNGQGNETKLTIRLNS